MAHGGVFIVAGATTKKSELLNNKFFILFRNRIDLFDLLTFLEENVGYSGA